ncbi:PAAR domain-containing protein [Paraburkholderia sp. FT54]|uniref:PAAR domain-containing protein n=1 Tax=Paraburkholderia sp. FT54 TaxID=3074437 RepID=UPI0028779ED1|nr:PAAR domain-containing protein [Paraburkholderia sp. FT54]WNC92483.1 PAAR domain-containing protein [Paraburkholderia sp. FT54]
MSDQERKGTLYRFATVGTRTGRGGRVSTGQAGKLAGLPLACVGDVVTYRDGVEAVIMDGAGCAATYEGAPFALVGSSLSNGDRIIETLCAELNAGIFLEDGQQIFVPVNEHGNVIQLQ